MSKSQRTNQASAGAGWAIEHGCCTDARRNERTRVIVVIPVYNEASTIQDVLSGIPRWVETILVVDDGSDDGTFEIVARAASVDERILWVRHDTNRGLTAAMVTVLERARCLEPDIVVKMDGDGQMSAADLPALLTPLLTGVADVVKGDRFRHLRALRQMPLLRRIGNLLVSFFSRPATGYWSLSDPTNGFLALRREVLQAVRLDTLKGYFFFETALLAELYLTGAVIEQVPLAACYRGETSHMSVTRVALSYPARLLRLLVRRIVWRYLACDFSLGSIYLLLGVPLLAIGSCYGGWQWWHFSQHHMAAPTGTVVIPALLIIVGMQLLLAFIQADVESVPTRPLSLGARLRPPDEPANDQELS